MSKKDYQAIARALWMAQGKDPEGLRPEVMNGVVFEVASVLAADNPRFDRERFTEACETGKCRGMRGGK